jgi:hypothetical protein
MSTLIFFRSKDLSTSQSECNFNKSKKFILLRLCLGVLLLPACKLAGTLAPSPGTYTGQYNQQEVVAQVHSIHNKKLIIQISPAADKPTEYPSQLIGPVTFTAKLNISGNLHVSSSSPDFPNYKFIPSSTSCFTSVKTSSNKNSSLEFCWGGDKIHVIGNLQTAQVFELSLTLSLAEEMPTLEIPTRFKVSDLIERSKSHNFESVVEFQKVLEAKSQAEVAYLGLLPHASLNAGLALISLNYQFIIRSIGDLAPFLLPSRWALAAEAKDLLVAEKQAWIIMNLDGMNITESLAKSARRDSEALARLNTQKEIIEGLRDLVRVKEGAGLLQLGSSDALTSLMNQIQMNLIQLEGVQRIELSALSHAAGFYNPRAIIGIDPEDTHLSGLADSVQLPIQLDFNTSLQNAIVRSAELRQVLAMVQWARDNRTERIFNWLDPVSALGSTLGANYPAYMKVSFYQIDEMIARKEQLKSIIFKKVSDTFTQLNLNVQDYTLAVQSKEIQERRVLRISQNLKTGINFIMSDLVLALEDQVKADLDIVNTQYGYLIALSRLNRLLYQGPYAEGLAEDKTEL